MAEEAAEDMEEDALDCADADADADSAAKAAPMTPDQLAQLDRLSNYVEMALGNMNPKTAALAQVGVLRVRACVCAHACVRGGAGGI